MKKILFSTLITIALASCGGETESNSDKNNNSKDDSTLVSEETDTGDTTSTTVDSLVYLPNYEKPFGELSGNELKICKLYLGDSLTAEVLALHDLFGQITITKHMRSYYGFLMNLKSKLSYKLSDKMQDDNFRKKVLAQVEKSKLEAEYFEEYSTVLDEMREQLAKLSKYFHGMKPSCVAECTEPYFNLVIADLLPTAKKTEGEDDDKYFDLIAEYYHKDFEPTSMNAKWFEATWDYGGSSKLGDGFHLGFLLATDKLMKEKNIFEEWILGYREDCFSDMTRWKSYQYGKEKLLKEINKVFKQVKLDESQLEQLKARKKELDEFIENDKTGYGLQLNCIDGGCIYG